MTRTGAAARPPLEARSATLIDWTYSHVKELGIATAVLAAALAGIWLYRSNQATRAAGAERAMMEAARSYYSGNLPLAQSDLQKVVTRFEGTPAAVQSAMLLAQVLYDQGKFAEGVAELEKVIDDGAADTFRASIRSLIAAGLEGQGKLKEAGQQYEQAASAAEFDAEKQLMRGNAARSYQAAGDTAAARRIWAEMADDPTNPVAGEARIRLGELTAEPIKN